MQLFFPENGVRLSDCQIVRLLVAGGLIAPKSLVPVECVRRGVSCACVCFWVIRCIVEIRPGSDLYQLVSTL